MLVNLIGVLISLSATHPLRIWLGIEINLIGTMPLLVTNFSAISAERGVKYFLVQSVGSAFIVIGTAGYGISLQS
jgi:NADH:ubiquinone oxidoreductase subunit 2 (subunit N)